MSTITQGQRFRAHAVMANADLVAPKSVNMLSPDDGFINEVAVIVQDAIATGGTIQVLNGAGVAIPGLLIAVPNGAAIGTIFSATATKGALQRAVARNARIQALPAGFAGAGAVRIETTVYTADNPQMPY